MIREGLLMLQGLFLQLAPPIFNSTTDFLRPPRSIKPIKPMKTFPLRKKKFFLHSQHSQFPIGIWSWLGLSE